MRIALWNGSGLDNLGDRLLDHVNRHELGRRLPDATFQTFSPWPCPHLPLVEINESGSWKEEGKFDGIVIGGGAVLIGPPFVHPSLQTCFLGPYPERFRDRCPLVWNAVCCDGQFVQSLAAPWRDYVQAAARRLTFRSVRNQGTADLLRECGVAEPLAVVPDPVLLLPELAVRDGKRRGRRRIGVMLGTTSCSPSLVAYLESPARSAWNPAVRVQPKSHALPDLVRTAEPRASTLLDQIAKALQNVRRHDEVEVCAFGATYGDRQTATALAQRLRCSQNVIHDPLGTDAIAWIASLDCLVGSRLHACILGLAAGIPLIALDPYLNPVTGTSKVRELMESAGLLDCYQPLADFPAEAARFDELIETALVGRDRLLSARESFRRRGTLHFDQLGQHLCQ